MRAANENGKGEVIENMVKAIDEMETKVSILENDLTRLNEERTRLKQPCQLNSPDSSDFSCQPFAEQSDLLSKQIQMLEQVNKNLAEDLQEWKNAYIEKTVESDQNRDKYLRAQQSAEELRRQLDSINKESARSHEQVNSNLQLANERFKEQLGELGHLPFILEAKQLELQESQSKLKLAERTISALSGDLESCIVKCELLQKSLELERAKITKLNQEAEGYQREIADWKEKYDDLEKENSLLLKSVEKMKFLEDCLESKNGLTMQQNRQLEQIRQENSRHVQRIKERAETQKRAFQSQIVGLEKELVQLRVNLSSTHKERDEMKQRMQNEISKLEQKFSDAQIEIQNLKSHVDILKSSYTNMMEELDDSQGGESDDSEYNEINNQY